MDRRTFLKALAGVPLAIVSARVIAESEAPTADGGLRNVGFDLSTKPDESVFFRNDMFFCHDGQQNFVWIESRDGISWDESRRFYVQHADGRWLNSSGEELKPKGEGR